MWRPLGHTAASGDCFACLWEGWASAAAPLVEHPGRRYRLYAGHLPRHEQFSLVNLAFPPHAASPFLAQPPNIFWPADHSWCVASEIDFDSTLVGGAPALVDAIVNHPDLEAWSVNPADSLAIDGDPINPVRQLAPPKRPRWFR